MSPTLEAQIGNRTRRRQEKTMALATLALGLMFTIAAQTFGPGGPLGLLAWIMPAAAWGALFVLLGTARLMTLIVNGYWPLGPRVRWVLSILSILLVWAPLAVGYAMALPTSLGFPTLVLAPIALMGEVNTLLALAALLAGRERAR